MGKGIARICLLAFVCGGFWACTLGAPVRIKTGPRITAVTTSPPLVTTLAELGFTIRTTDAASGLVNTEWREYEIPYGKDQMIVRDRVQATASAKGALVQYTAECRTIAQASFTPCRDLNKQTLLRDALTAEYRKIHKTVSDSGGPNT